jgi:hypothetical protein
MTIFEPPAGASPMRLLSMAEVDGGAHVACADATHAAVTAEVSVGASMADAAGRGAAAKSAHTAGDRAAYDEARALLVFNNDKAGMGAISAADKERISAKVLEMSRNSAFDANQVCIDDAAHTDLASQTLR